VPRPTARSATLPRQPNLPRAPAPTPPPNPTPPCPPGKPASPAIAGGAAAPAQQQAVPVTFSVQFCAGPGTAVAVCGDAHALGAWHPAGAARMARQGADRWVASIALPPG
jgi:hypothetical protein